MVLYTSDLYDIISKNSNLSKYFRGVYSINEMPFILMDKPSFIIINLSPSYEAGSHWVSVVIDKNDESYYFDSYGNIPPSEIINFLERNSKVWYYNNMKFQGNLSVLCGYFVIMFAFYFFNDIQKFFKIFKECKHLLNDKLLINFFKEF